MPNPGKFNSTGDQKEKPVSPGAAKKALPKSASITEDKSANSSQTNSSTTSKTNLTNSTTEPINKQNNSSIEDSPYLPDYKPKDYSSQMLTISVAQAQGEFE